MSNDEYQQQDYWRKHLLREKGVYLFDPDPNKHPTVDYFETLKQTKNENQK